MVKRSLQSLLPELSLLVVAYFGYPPQSWTVDLHLCPDDFRNFSPYAFWLCNENPIVVYFKTALFFCSHVEWTTYRWTKQSTIYLRLGIFFHVHHKFSVPTVTLDYKALLLLLNIKEQEDFILGGKGYGVEFCAFCDAIRGLIKVSCILYFKYSSSVMIKWTERAK